jgi:DNA-binding transcriptional MerR regulator
MLRMPAATLRIWERRYGVAAPATTPSGHRQYSAADVQRLALVRQLTLVGHSIGSLASLDIERLREVASTHAAALTGVPDRERRSASTLKVGVVGRGAEHRLQRPDVLMRLDSVVKVTGAFDRLADVRRRASTARHDALIVFVDGLQASVLAEVQAAALALHAHRVAVVYSFASTSVQQAFAAAGISLLREPVDDAALAGWLRALISNPGERKRARRAIAGRGLDPLPITTAGQGQRRYDDATLADFAGLSSTIACECPRHLAEIIMKLSHFEAYSSQCEGLSAADAALHAFLGEVTGTARSMFESALERLAIHEGLVLPQR